MAQEDFRELIATLTRAIGSRALDRDLEDWLNVGFGPQTAPFEALKHACMEGVKSGWMCAREANGIRYGRVLKPADELNRFSVDVVDMCEIAGPEHRHPLGEIDLVMPLDAHARFDGHGAGWCVYAPQSVHRPTVTLGRALVLYLLPEGQIEFTPR